MVDILMKALILAALLIVTPARAAYAPRTTIYSSGGTELGTLANPFIVSASGMTVTATGSNRVGYEYRLITGNSIGAIHTVPAGKTATLYVRRAQIFSGTLEIHPSGISTAGFIQTITGPTSWTTSTGSGIYYLGPGDVIFANAIGTSSSYDLLIWQDE
jgi:hypothetical protein